MARVFTSLDRDDAFDLANGVDTTPIEPIVPEKRVRPDPADVNPVKVPGSRIIYLGGLGDQYHALVDESLWDWLMDGPRWTAAHTCGKRVYAIRQVTCLVDGARKRVTEYMQRVVLGLGREDEDVVDHLGSPLDNRKEKLRVISQGENLGNLSGYSRESNSGFRGVHMLPERHPSGGLRIRRYAAYFNHKSRRHSCGVHSSPEEAAIARDRKVLELCRNNPVEVLERILNFPGLVGAGVAQRDKGARATSDDIPF